MDRKINTQIKEKIVDVVKTDGSLERGVLLKNALEMAEEEEMDLVQVSFAEQGKLAVCRILDYGKVLYKQSKKQKAHRQITKEMRINYNIDPHDLKTKNNKVFKFLEKKCIVKYSIDLHGREKSMLEKAKEMMQEIMNEFSSVSKQDPFSVSCGEKTIRILTTLYPL